MPKSVRQNESKNIFQSISSGISVIRTNNNTQKNNSSKSHSNLLNQFEEFAKWKKTDSSPFLDDDMPIVLEETGPSGRSASTPQTSINPLPLKLPNSTNLSITKTPSASSTPVVDYKTRKAPKTRRAPEKGASTPASPAIIANQINNPPNICDQTLNQPLNPSIFLPGALKCFPRSRSPVADMIYSNMINTRKYPQILNESVNKLGSTFMAAPTPEILTLMCDETFPKDFHIKNCKSSSEYLYCLMGFGLHQTLNFPIMGVFYLELVRLILKNMDRFSGNEKVKFIQVRVICEDILRQNSVRDDFLPVETMETIVDKVVKEHNNIQHLIEEQESKEKENEANKNTNTCQFKTPEIPVRNSKRKRNDELDTEVLLIDLDQEDEQSTLDLYTKSYSEISKLSSSSPSDNKTKSISSSRTDYPKEDSSNEMCIKDKASQIYNGDDQPSKFKKELKRLRRSGVSGYVKTGNIIDLDSDSDTESEKVDVSDIFKENSRENIHDDIVVMKSPQKNQEQNLKGRIKKHKLNDLSKELAVNHSSDDIVNLKVQSSNPRKLNDLGKEITRESINDDIVVMRSPQKNEVFVDDLLSYPKEQNRKERSNTLKLNDLSKELTVKHSSDDIVNLKVQSSNTRKLNDLGKEITQDSINGDNDDIVVMRSPQKNEVFVDDLLSYPKEENLKERSNTHKLNDLSKELTVKHSSENKVNLKLQSSENNVVDSVSSILTSNMPTEISDLICDIKNLIDNEVQPGDTESGILDIQPNDIENNFENIVNSIEVVLNKKDEPCDTEKLIDKKEVQSCDTEAVSEYLNMFEKPKVQSCGETESIFGKGVGSMNKSSDKNKIKNMTISSPPKNKASPQVQNKLINDIKSMLQDSEIVSTNLPFIKSNENNFEKNTEENTVREDIGIFDMLNSESDDNNSKRNAEEVKDQLCNDCFDFFNTENDLKKHICGGKNKKREQATSRSNISKELEGSGLHLDSDSDSDEDEGSSRLYNWNDL